MCSRRENLTSWRVLKVCFALPTANMQDRYSKCSDIELAPIVDRPAAISKRPTRNERLSQLIPDSHCRNWKKLFKAASRSHIRYVALGFRCCLLKRTGRETRI